jgi:agmatine deiminase
VLNFNNWGNKVKDPGDSRVAPLMLEALGNPVVTATFVGEDDRLEVDGEGTLLATESSILNSNGKTKADIEAEFFRLFGITKTIWLKGVKDHEITDCHTDAVARFVSPGLVVLTRPSSSDPEAEKEMYEDAKERLLKETDAKGRPLTVVELPESDYLHFMHQHSVSYVDYYVANGAIIASKFGDQKADAEAKRILGELFPERVIEQVSLKQLPVHGGGIQCATQQILA